MTIQDDFRINNDSQLFFYAQKMDRHVYDYREELTMSEKKKLIKKYKEYVKVLS
jgi:hypothetical protein